MSKLNEILMCAKLKKYKYVLEFLVGKIDDVVIAKCEGNLITVLKKPTPILHDGNTIEIEFKTETLALQHMHISGQEILGAKDCNNIFHFKIKPEKHVPMVKNETQTFIKTHKTSTTSKLITSGRFGEWKDKK